MKEKTTELLKNLLLLRYAGAWDSVDKEINIAIDLYCETNNKDRDQLIDKLKSIDKRVFKREVFLTLDGYEEAHETYRLYINDLFNNN